MRRQLCVLLLKVWGESVGANLATMNNQARWLQKSECESYRHMTSHDVLNSRADAQGDVICSLRDNIRRLLTENEELCDLCCFLDDDRQQYRRDATEWQKLHQQMATEITQKVFRLAMTACRDAVHAFHTDPRNPPQPPRLFYGVH